MFQVVYPGSGSKFFTHPGSRSQKGTGSRIRIRNTVSVTHSFFPMSLCFLSPLILFSLSLSRFLSLLSLSVLSHLFSFLTHSVSFPGLLFLSSLPFSALSPYALSPTFSVLTHSFFFEFVSLFLSFLPFSALSPYALSPTFSVLIHSFFFDFLSLFLSFLTFLSFLFLFVSQSFCRIVSLLSLLMCPHSFVCFLSHALFVPPLFSSFSFCHSLSVVSHSFCHVALFSVILFIFLFSHFPSSPILFVLTRLSVIFLFMFFRILPILTSSFYFALSHSFESVVLSSITFSLVLFLSFCVSSNCFLLFCVSSNCFLSFCVSSNYFLSFCVSSNCFLSFCVSSHCFLSFCVSSNCFLSFCVSSHCFL
jgi:hypothetical protein